MQWSVLWSHLRRLPLVLLRRPFYLVPVAVLLLHGWVRWSTPQVVQEPAQTTEKISESRGVSTTVQPRHTLAEGLEQLRQASYAQTQALTSLGALAKDLQGQVKALEQARQQDKQEAATREQQRQRAHEQALQAAKKGGGVQRSTPLASRSAGPALTPSQEGQAPASLFKLRTLRADPSAAQRALALANPGETAYLPADSFAQGRVVTGVIATARTGGEQEMLISVTSPFTTAWHLQGPGRNPLATSVPLQGCFIGAHATANMGSGRVEAKLLRLTCVMPDKSAFERPIEGYAVDIDGAFGIVGDLVTHNSAQEAKAFITAILGEASAALGLARSKFIVTVPGGGPLPFQSTQRGLDKLTDVYLQQMSYLLPTLTVHSRHEVGLVITKGVALEGLPLMITVEER